MSKKLGVCKKVSIPVYGGMTFSLSFIVSLSHFNPRVWGYDPTTIRKIAFVSTSALPLYRPLYICFLTSFIKLGGRARKKLETFQWSLTTPSFPFSWGKIGMFSPTSRPHIFVKAAIFLEFCLEEFSYYLQS